MLDPVMLQRTVGVIFIPCICTDEHQHAYKTVLYVLRMENLLRGKTSTGLFFSFLHLMGFGANVEMFTQIIAQGHWK